MQNRVTKTVINYDRKVKYILDIKDLAEMCANRWAEIHSELATNGWTLSDVDAFHASILNSDRTLGEWLKDPEEPAEAPEDSHPAYDDDNNCTVRALSVAFEQPLHVIYDLLKQRGRRHGRGMHTPSYHKALRELADQFGYVATPVDARRDYGKTVVSAARRVMANERCIFQTSGHTLAVVGGTVHDWTDGRRNHIMPFKRDCSYRITRK